MEARACFTVLFGICAVGNAGNVGTFWQLTDLHLDESYSEHGLLESFCHGSGSRESNGRYGNFSCDSPEILVEESIQAMKNINAEPDFILWTGDIMPHINDTQTSWVDVYSKLKLVTSLLMDAFKNTTIIPVLGNHDAHPPNEYPGTDFKEHYQGYLTEAGWEMLIPPEEVGRFRKGGYYSHVVSETLKIIVLNTNLYLNTNPKRSSEPDPGGQLEWLRKQLKLARDDKTAVLIAAHAPPGFFERVPNGPFLASPYNEALIGLFVNYSDVLLTQVYGHTHTDSFRLFSDSTGVAKTHGFIAPSISPWGVPGTGMNGVNPSVRLYHYNVTNVTVLDYQQYYLNLTKANAQNSELASPKASVEAEILPTPQSLVEHREAKSSVQDGRKGKSTSPGASASKAVTDAGKSEETSSDNHLTWELLYQATELYGVPDLSVQSLAKIFTDMSIKASVFETYYEMNTVGVPGDACDNKCRQIHLCAIRQLTTETMDKCLSKNNISEKFPNRRDKTTKSPEDGVAPQNGPTATTTMTHDPSEDNPKKHHRHHSAPTTTTMTHDPSEDSPKGHHRHHNAPPAYMKHVILGTALALLTVLIIVTAVCMRRLKHRLGYRHTRLISINND